MTAKLTERIDINVGTPCNANCRFCYYSQSIREKEAGLFTDQVKKLLRFARKREMKIVEFTGGEPTIRRDIIDLIHFAKGLGFESVSMITNGIVLPRGDFAKRLVAAGVDDFLFSIHGMDSEVHDALTGVPGSFGSIVESIKIVSDLGAKIRANTVVVRQNYKTLLGIAPLLEQLQVRAANFLVFNRTAQAEAANMDIDVRYLEAAAVLQKLIENYSTRIPKITVREIPFCIMVGYEQYVTNTLQLQYDPDEWNYLVRYGSAYGLKFTRRAMIKGILNLPRHRRFPYVNWDTTKHEGIMKYRAITSKVKGPQCRHCKYDLICDGVWNAYARNYGFEELKAKAGRKVADPTYFMT